MKIDSINLVNFRNYESLNIKFSKFLNIIYGKNGMGKTNLIEAIYLLSLTKSFRISNDKSLIKKGCLKTKVRGEIIKNDDLSSYEVIISNDGKNVLIDNNKVDKISDYVSKINIILFSPIDTRLIDESPSERRKMINIEISQLYKEYLIILANYQKILKQRNFYLRSLYLNANKDTQYLDILTRKLIEYGLLIYKYRSNFCENINKYIGEIYNKIFKNGNLKVKYISNYKNKNSEQLLKSYQNNYKKEMEIGKTLLGVHHDDIAFILDDNNLKDWGSEGQRKNAIISFKLAEINLVYEVKNNYPILILDDLFSELDKEKITNILKILDKNVQTFITTTEINKIDKKIKDNAKIFKVDNGNIKEDTNE